MTTTSDTAVEIPPGERRELRSVVRSQYKVLRAEVAHRQAELLAEGEELLRVKYEASDTAVNDLNKKIQAIAKAAQKKVDALIAESGIPQDSWRSQSALIRADRFYPRATDKRNDLKKSFIAAVHSQAKSAMLALDRQEADLLRNLAVDGIKTEQGRAMLGTIPAITALMPSERLAEIAAEFDWR